MTNISIKVDGATATVSANGKLTSGMVGVPVTIEYDESWNNLSKVIVFRCDGIVRDRRTNELSTTVPWEVLRRPGKVLEVGVEGRNKDGSLVIPTIWATIGRVEFGASPNVPGAPHPDDPGYEYNNAVLYVPQSLTEEQQKQARENIGVVPVENAVLYTEQTITPEEQAQARVNIGAAPTTTIWELIVQVELDDEGNPTVRDGIIDCIIKSSRDSVSYPTAERVQEVANANNGTEGLYQEVFVNVLSQASYNNQLGIIFCQLAGDAGDRIVFTGKYEWFGDFYLSIGSSDEIAYFLLDLPPQKGVDYWTDSDKAEIKAYVDEAILGGEW